LSKREEAEAGSQSGSVVTGIFASLQQITGYSGEGE
jgi:hypothetical protein